MSKPENEFDWRKLIVKPCSALEVGGFRPSGDLTSSCFGEVRVARKGEAWPEYNGQALWPVCQLNFLAAPFVPNNLRDIVMLQLFITDAYWSIDHRVIDSKEEVTVSQFVIRTYDSLLGLQPVRVPNHTSPIKAFEARWKANVQMDHTTHHTLPIDFDSLGIGGYYDQDGIEQIRATKIGGWPSCIQSEPWWDYREEGQDFKFALQIDSDEKANCCWGDMGTIYIARHKDNGNLWAIDFQCY